MRGRPVFSSHAQEQVVDKQTNEIFSYNLELPNEEGNTTQSPSFVAFFNMKVETTALSI